MLETFSFYEETIAFNFGSGILFFNDFFQHLYIYIYIFQSHLSIPQPLSSEKYLSPRHCQTHGLIFT